MIRRHALTALFALAALAILGPIHGAAAAECEPKASCFGVESLSASLSTSQAGAHPDVSFSFDITQDPESPLNKSGLHDSYAPTRYVRVDLPPGLLADPNVLGATQQCTVAELSGGIEGECPNGSQVGVTKIYTILPAVFSEPIYMMQPPGGDVVARLGFIAGFLPTFIDVRVRSESDYGVTSEIVDSPAAARLVRAETTLWGVPAAASHDTERCTIQEATSGCVASPSRPPGSRPLPFWTNPTRCGVPLSMSVSAASWAEPERFDTKSAEFPTIAGCNNLPFGPSLEVEPTSHRAAAPTGLDLTIKLPASEGVNVLEPSQTRYMRFDFPQGLSINTGSADGLGTCSAQQVRFEENAAAECPGSAKLASTEFDVPVLERNLKGAIYLREPEPGHPFRIWIVADDLGLHLKLPAELEVDKATGQIHSIVLGAPKLEGLPQSPLREVKLELKSGFRAPLVNPQQCGEYRSHYEFTPWSGGPAAVGFTKSFTIDEGCETGGFNPKLSAGSTDAQGGAFSPFLFTLTREDGEQNPQGLDITLPQGFAAAFTGIARCEGAAAETGQCPADSRIGKVVTAVGAGPAPLWVPQPGKRPTGVYLGGPYKGAPTSIVAVVPKQAGPFDFGDEVVRSAIYVDPTTARATAVTDPLPQMIEGIPITYKTINVQLDRQDFALNPTSCALKQTEATLTSVLGVVAHPTSSYAAVNCAKLAFEPALKLSLRGGTKRSDHPQLRATLKMPPGGANIAKASVALPHSEFLDQGSLNRVCTRVEFAAKACPAGSVYGTAIARSPLFDFPLTGNVYLGTGYGHKLPDLVAELKGPPSFPIEIDLDGRIDEILRKLPDGERVGLIRTNFETAPDAPVSEFSLVMRGGKQGLLENSENLCLRPRRATVAFTGQNGKVQKSRPALKTSCKPKRRGARR